MIFLRLMSLGTHFRVSSFIVGIEKCLQDCIKPSETLLRAMLMTVLIFFKYFTTGTGFNLGILLDGFLRAGKLTVRNSRSGFVSVDC